MLSTSALQSDMQEISSLMNSLPEIEYANVPIEKLFVPKGLYDGSTTLANQAFVFSSMPILVTKDSTGQGFVIVDGCKRFHLYKTKLLPHCMCGIFTKTMDTKTMGLMRILLTKGRAVPIKEGVLLYKWMLNNYSKDICEKIAQEAGLALFEIKPLISCDDDVLNAVAQGRIQSKNAHDFSMLSKEDQKAFLDIFKGFVLSQQTQREYIEWLPEIAFAKNISLPTLLTLPEILEIIDNKSLNNPQKIEGLRNLFFSWKYPAFNTTLKKWKTLAGETSRMATGDDATTQLVFLPNPAFEKNKLELRISLAHARAAKELFERLNEIPLSTWAKLIYPVED